MEIIKDRANLLNLDFVLIDKAAPEERRFLYDSRSPISKVITMPLPHMPKEMTSRSMSFVGLDLEITFFNKNSHDTNTHWVLWAVVTGGVLFIGLFSILILFVTGRSDLIQKAVDEKNYELKSAVEELEQFAYRTSHDLRSPLVSSIGLLGYVESQLPKDNERVNQSVALVIKSLTKLEVLITDILELTKTTHDSHPLEAINLVELIEDSCEKLSHMEGFSKISLQKNFRYKDNLTSVKHHWLLIIENLISNAVKYQNTSISDSFIKISVYEEEAKVVFQVEDNGLGIPDEYKEKLFSMFQRFHPKVSFGSGLGMYMIKKAVEGLGADIEYEDTGSGSLFRVSVVKKV